MLFASAHKKCLAQKVGHLGSLGPIPIIQPPFCSSCVALHYETGMKFFHWPVPELCDINNQKISAQLCGVSVHFLHVYEVSDDFCWKCLVDDSDTIIQRCSSVVFRHGKGAMACISVIMLTMKYMQRQGWALPGKEWASNSLGWSSLQVYCHPVVQFVSALNYSGFARLGRSTYW